MPAPLTTEFSRIPLRRVGASKALAQVFDASPRELLDAGAIVEHFDRDPAAIADLFEGREDRLELQSAEAGPLTIRIVRVEMNEFVAMAANQIRDRRRLAGHGFAIEVQAAMRRADHLDQVCPLGPSE